MKNYVHLGFVAVSVAVTVAEPVAVSVGGDSVAVTVTVMDGHRDGLVDGDGNLLNDGNVNGVGLLHRNGVRSVNGNGVRLGDFDVNRDVVGLLDDVRLGNVDDVRPRDLNLVMHGGMASSPRR